MSNEPKPKTLNFFLLFFTTFGTITNKTQHFPVNVNPLFLPRGDISHFKNTQVVLWQKTPYLFNNIPLTDARSDFRLSSWKRRAFCCAADCTSLRSDVTLLFNTSKDLRSSSIHSAVDLRFGSSTNIKCFRQFCKKR